MPIAKVGVPHARLRHHEHGGAFAQGDVGFRVEPPETLVMMSILRSHPNSLRRQTL
jgi:hypothetical protein